MKIVVIMKNPDALEVALDHQVLDPDEWIKVHQLITRKWMNQGEYLYVEFDLDNNTARVVENPK